MQWKDEIRRSFAARVPDDDVVEELAQHAAALYEAARAEGLSADDARGRVHEQITAWAAQADGLRRASRRVAPVPPPPVSASLLTGLAHDVRYALRMLARRPAAAGVAIVTMALGIAATTVLFSAAWGVLFKPLPWADSDRLIRLTETREGSTRKLPDVITNGTYLSWRDAPQTIDALAGYAPGNATFGGAAEPERLRVAEVTPTLFPLLRARPALGAVFDDRPEHDRTIVLSHGLWQDKFAGAADVIGRAVRLDGETYTVAGVMPREFYFPDRETRAWTPLRVPPVIGPGEGRAIAIFSGIARLKPGATVAQAAAEGTARGRSAPDPGLTAMAMFGSRGPVIVGAEPMLAAMTKDVRPALLIFLVAVGLLLATATANVASVQLARATTRRREIAIRAALGAGSARLGRQLLVENLLAGAIGGGLGLILAMWLHRLLPSLLPADFPRARDIALDARVLAFAVGISLVASVACGILPILHARRLNLVESLTEDGLAPAGGGRTKMARARLAIMVGQVAVSAVLLIGAALLVRSFVAMLHADRGFDPSNVLTARIPLPSPGYTDARRAAIMTGLVERMRRTPGVVEAGFTSILPLGGSESLFAFTLPADASGARPGANAALRTVTPEYPALMGIRLLEGRALNEHDTWSSLPVVLVNRTFAQRYFPDGALGKRIPANFEEGRRDWEIVGIVEDVRGGGLSDPLQPEIYVSYAQRSGLGFAAPALVVRTSGDPAALIPELRAAARAEDPTLALDRIATLRQRLMTTLAAPRLYAVLLGGFAGCALVIAAVGLFAVLSYSVAQRAREIAVRSALGARPADIALLVLKQGLGVALAGLAIGIAASFALGAAMQSFLFGVVPHDPLTFAGGAAVLLVVSVIACLVPVRRALRLEPVQVLKAGGQG